GSGWDRVRGKGLSEPLGRNIGINVEPRRTGQVASHRATWKQFDGRLQGDIEKDIEFKTAMDATADTAQVIIRPPLAWGLAVIAGLALNWLVPSSFLPAGLPAGWLGAMVFVLALALRGDLLGVRGMQRTAQTTSVRLFAKLCLSSFPIISDPGGGKDYHFGVVF